MTALKQNKCLEDTINHWKHISKHIHEPQTASEYTQLALLLDDLLDIIGEDESHELIGLIDVIGQMLTQFDEKHPESIEAGSVLDALKFLMAQHNLNQNDLQAELGSQGVVSEILNGKRQLNLAHIKKLADRFNVSPMTFIDED